MSGKNKLFRFAQVAQFSNVIECADMARPAELTRAGERIDIQGRWREAQFGNARPITLELACGGGEYAVELGRRRPENNYVGIDIKGARIWKGARAALAEGLSNVAFLRARIEGIEHFFGPSEVDELWITFPDPFLRLSKAEKRLTSPVFLERYRAILKPGGLVHLKTDERRLFDYTLRTLAADPRCRVLYRTDDVHGGPLAYEELGIKTFYESKDIAGENRVKYIRFTIH